MQIIEAYSPSLHLGSGPIAYSQFLIGKKNHYNRKVSLFCRDQGLLAKQIFISLVDL